MKHLFLLSLFLLIGCNENHTMNGISVERLLENDKQIVDKVCNSSREYADYIGSIDGKLYIISSVSLSQGTMIVVLNKVK